MFHRIPFIKITCLVTTPSPFLSIFLNNFSIGDSSPMNSSKLNRPSKSLSILEKKSSTSSLKQNEIQLQVFRRDSGEIEMKSFKKYIDVGTPELLRTCLHSSGVSFPSLFLSALLNILRTFENNK